ncbi:MAG TPA: O-antigen ligase family protein [Ardenticatenaceae bacterium]|jgi:O-antigen ligase
MVTRAALPKTEHLLPLIFGTLALVGGVGAAMLSVSGFSPLKLVILIAGLAVLGFSLARLEWGLALLIFLAYTRSSDVAVHFHGAPSILQPFLLMLLVGVFFRWHSHGERPSGWSQPLILLALYGLVRFASLLYAADFMLAQNALIDYIKDAIIAVIIVMLLQRVGALHKTVWAMLVAGAFMCTITVIQYITGTFYNNYFGFADASVQHLIGNTGGYRIAGPIGDPNFFGQIIVPLVPIALERALHTRSIPLRLLAFYTLTVCVLTIVFTFSRGTFVAMAAALGLYMLYRGIRVREVALALLLMIPVFQFLPAEYTARILTMTEILPWNETDPKAEVSFRGRTSEALVAAAMFSDRPLLGVGLHNYPIYYQDYSQRLGLDPRREQRAPHSLFLEIASETGLLGVITFGLLMWGMFHRIWTARQLFFQANLKDDGSMVVALGVGIVGYLIAAIFLHGAFPRYLYLLFGIAMATPQIARHEVEMQRIRLVRAKERARLRTLRDTPTPPTPFRLMR